MFGFYIKTNHIHTSNLNMQHANGKDITLENERVIGLITSAVVQELGAGHDGDFFKRIKELKAVECVEKMVRRGEEEAETRRISNSRRPRCE